MDSYDFAGATKYFRDILSFTMGPIELRRKMERGEDLNIIDVRRAADFNEGHIPGAKNIPVDKQGDTYTWKDHSLLSKTKINVIYCYTIVCHSSAAAALDFATRGYPAVELHGGFETWKQKGLPIEKLECATAGSDKRECNCS
jgi:rhodanese-related sulfurtransferase